MSEIYKQKQYELEKELEHIEMLNNIIPKYEDYVKETNDFINILLEETKEINILRNIIKEVREYIENNQEEHKFTDRGGFTYTEGHFLRDSDTLLEILDKVEENK